MTDRDIRDRLRQAGTTALSDALDKLAIPGQILGVMPVVRSMRFAGRAFTVRMLPVGTSGGSVGDYLDEVGEGQVVVLANDGRRDATVWGDIMTFVASERGIAATVIDGVCRDSDRCVELGYPVFALGNTMRTGKDRVTADAFNVPVRVADVRVAPGDWMVGDADGVVAIPSEQVLEILAIAEAIEASEARIRELVGAGMRLDEARRSTGYHQLQTPGP